MNVQLAVEEAVTNICLHAYAEEAAVNLLSYSYRATGGFVLRIRHEKGTFEIDLIDQGPAFNPLLAIPLDLKSIWEDPKARGIGIHLMQRMTDDLRYKRVEHNNVQMLQNSHFRDMRVRVFAKESSTKWVELLTFDIPRTVLTK